MQVAISVKGLDKIMKNFSTASPLVKQEINLAVNRSAIAVQRSAKIESPIRTGNLRSNIRYSASNGRGRVGSYVQYSVYVHEGTKHQRANPFMDRALMNTQDDINREFERAVTVITKHLGKD
jgi:HK97 gp10 family phage protein